MCGEHRSSLIRLYTFSGSSPHVRGARSVWSCYVCYLQDHPRMCGEHLSVYRIRHLPAGSSPHVRGAPWKVQRELKEYRIIPACAGSTFVPYVVLFCTKDHPRMCGEHVYRRRRLSLVLGSSPHVRGALGKVICFPKKYRIIPACAGSTVTGGLVNHSA